MLVAYPLREEYVPELVQFHVEEGNARWAAGRRDGWLSGPLAANFLVPEAACAAVAVPQLQPGQCILAYCLELGLGSDRFGEEEQALLASLRDDSAPLVVIRGRAAAGSSDWREGAFVSAKPRTPRHLDSREGIEVRVP